MIRLHFLPAKARWLAQRLTEYGVPFELEDTVITIADEDIKGALTALPLPALALDNVHYQRGYAEEMLADLLADELEVDSAWEDAKLLANGDQQALHPAYNWLCAMGYGTPGSGADYELELTILRTEWCDVWVSVQADLASNNA